MYECFTDRGRSVLQFANEEAQRLNHEYISPEHILLGLVNDNASAAIEVLQHFGIDPHVIPQKVEEIVAVGATRAPSGKLPLSAKTKNVIEFAKEEAQRLGENLVAPEHVLLGLVRADDAVATPVLLKLGLNLENVRVVLNRMKPGRPGARVGPMAGMP